MIEGDLQGIATESAVTVAGEGPDAGKTFVITEMLTAAAEAWATEAFRAWRPDMGGGA